jgi:hypothetical protein
VLKSLESGRRAAIEAVRKFVDTVDQTLPPHGETPSRRQEVIDSAMEMADRLVHVQYDFLRKVVANAGKSGPGSSAAAARIIVMLLGSVIDLLKRVYAWPCEVTSAIGSRAA